MDWQSIAAVLVVALTLAVFLLRMARPRPKSRCGRRCACGKDSAKKFE